MEPVSQAVLGVMGGHLVPSKIANRVKIKNKFKWISLWAALGGMAPDLDYIIRSSTDPLFTIQYHRQFTHSLIFIPIGALVVSLFLRLFKVKIKHSYPYTLLGYATHGLLDAFTNYGTQLLWPFSKERASWNCVAVVDPLLTIPLVILLIISIRKENRKYLLIGWAYLCTYLGYGFYQKVRVEDFSKKIGLINQGSERFMIKPTIANNFLWRVIVDQGDYFSFDAVRSPLFGEMKHYPGKTAKQVFENDILKLIPKGSKQYKDYLRFKYFTGDYLTWVSDKIISDARYSLVANDSKPLWSIEFNPKGYEEHIIYKIERKPTDQNKQDLIKMWKGLD